MAKGNTNPFRVIETAKPGISVAEAKALARDRYGLEAEATELVSERDQNFQLRTTDGAEYVLKIANPAEDPLVAEMQIEALLHLEACRAGQTSTTPTPEIRRTVDGQTSFREAWQEQPVTVRLVTFVPGVPLGRRSTSPPLCRDLGACLAALDGALAEFEHPGGDHSFLWDMKEALRLRELLPHIPDERIRGRVARTLDDFACNALPAFAALRWQVIHNDLNPENVLVAPQDRDRIVGVIDFGDMCRAPLVVDVAVAAAYLRVTNGDPLSAIAEFLAGFTTVYPLFREEIDVLFDLIKTRLATTISIMHWRRSLKPAHDPYLQKAVSSGPSAEVFLAKLAEMPRAHARQVFRQVCASPG